MHRYPNKQCPYCMNWVNERAIRCGYCTSFLEGQNDHEKQLVTEQRPVTEGTVHAILFWFIVLIVLPAVGGFIWSIFS